MLPSAAEDVQQSSIRMQARSHHNGDYTSEKKTLPNTPIPCSNINPTMHGMPEHLLP